MADTKISALTDGVTANSTDRLPAARDGSNVYVSPGYLSTFVEGLTHTWSQAQTFSVAVNATQDIIASGTTTSGRGFSLAGQNGTGIGAVSSSGNHLEFWAQGVRWAGVKSDGGMVTTGTGYFGIAATSGNIASTVDTTLYRDAADTFAQRRSTNPQTFRVYNTFTDSSNYERLHAEANASRSEVYTDRAGTGNKRDLWLSTKDGGTLLSFIKLVQDGSWIIGNGATQEIRNTNAFVEFPQGAFTTHATNGFGFKTGAGGTVTQTGSRTTGVTINKSTGAITLVSAAGSATFASFTVTNSAVAATDVVIVHQKSGTDLYEIHVTAVAASSFNVTFRTTGGTTTEQPVFNFAVIKGVTS